MVALLLPKGNGAPTLPQGSRPDHTETVAGNQNSAQRFSSGRSLSSELRRHQLLAAPPHTSGFTFRPFSSSPFRPVLR